MSQVIERVESEWVPIPGMFREWSEAVCEKGHSLRGAHWKRADGAEGSWCSWPVDAEGNPLRNYNLGPTGHTCDAPVKWVGHKEPELRRIPGYVVVKCDCGRKLECSAFTETCECGADYNWAGQRLAPRSQWGEETGEHWSDCY